MPLEIACFNIASAVAAAQAGADRIELCDNPQDGGTTPSYGTIRMAIEKISVPVFLIIRPRGGDFLYNADEFEAMLHDVQLCRDMGCKGIVLGLLKKNGSVDVARTIQLVQTAGEMEVTFHRAFDRAYHPIKALEDIIATGCKRLLTSGQKETAFEGKDLIRKLIQQAAGRITVMPGSGVRSSNIAFLKSFTGASEFHSSARIQVPSGMEFISTGIKEENSTTLVNKAEILHIKTVLTNGALIV